jgi:PAS domain S-box-containing protein
MVEELKDNKLYQGIFESSIEGILVVGKQGTILRANPSVEKMFGYGSGELVSKKVEDLIPDTFKKCHKTHRAKYNKKPKNRSIAKELDLWGLKKNGTQFPLEISLSPTTIEGKPVTIAFARDISEQTSALEKINLSKDRKFNSLINNLQGIVYKCKNDKTRTMDYISEGSHRITGYNPEEFLDGRVHLSDLTIQEDQEQVWTNIQKSLSKKEPFNLTYRIKNKKGNLKYMRELGRGIFDHNGNLEALEGYITDITDLKRAEEKLLVSETRNKAIIKAVPDSMFVLNKQGVYIDVHAKDPSMFAMSKAEIIGKNVREVLPKALCEKITAAFEDSQETKETQIIEYSLPIREELRYFEARIVAKENDNFLTIIRDVSKRKQAEEAIEEGEKELREYAAKLETKVTERTNDLKDIVQKLVELNLSLEDQVQTNKAAENRAVASQEMFSAISKNFPNGAIAVLNTQYQITHLDGEELTNFRLKGSDFKGVFIDGIQFLSVDQKMQIKKVIRKTLKGNHMTFETRFRKNTYAVNTMSLYDSDKKIQYALVVYNNISKQKQIEIEILNALTKEKELGELKSRFVDMASHEFRTPLSAILSAATLIGKQNGAGKEGIREGYVGRIKSNVKNMVVILNDFLSISKLEEGKIAVQPETFDLVDFSKSIIDEVKQSRKKGQRIILINEQPTLSVYLDSKMTHHILVNLLTNSIKYSPENKEVVLTISHFGKETFLTVKDQGIGIPKEDQKYLFQRFYRAKNAMNIQGTGLGLHIVKQYTELMGGTVTFSSNPAEGTTFSIKLPLNLNKK